MDFTCRTVLKYMLEECLGTIWEIAVQQSLLVWEKTTLNNKDD